MRQISNIYTIILLVFKSQIYKRQTTVNVKEKFPKTRTKQKNIKKFNVDKNSFLAQ